MNTINLLQIPVELIYYIGRLSFHTNTLMLNSTCKHIYENINLKLIYKNIKELPKLLLSKKINKDDTKNNFYVEYILGFKNITEISVDKQFKKYIMNNMVESTQLNHICIIKKVFVNNELQLNTIFANMPQLTSISICCTCDINGSIKYPSALKTLSIDCTDVYYDFFGVNILNLKHLKIKGASLIISEVVSSFSNITALSLYNCDKIDTVCNINIERLEMTVPATIDKIFIKKLRNLKYCKITTNCKYLQLEMQDNPKLSQLQTKNTECNTYQNGTVVQLAYDYLSTLEHNIHNNADKITSINLSLNRNNMMDFENIIKQVINLRKLIISCYFITNPPNQLNIQNLTNLEKMKVYTNIGLNYFFTNIPTTIKKLICSTGIDEKMLSTLTNLEKLYIYKYKHDYINDLSYLGKLKNLHINAICMSNIKNCNILHNLNINELCLTNFYIDENVVSKIKSIKKMKLIDCRNVSNKFITSMTQLKILRINEHRTPVEYLSDSKLDMNNIIKSLPYLEDIIIHLKKS